jgi:glycosyltransferase involved in cell wall biosynthesis
MIDIVIITRTWNRPKFFSFCLRSIIDQFYQGNIYHIIVDETEKNRRYAVQKVGEMARGNYFPFIFYRKHRQQKKYTVLQDDAILYHAPWNENMTFALNKVIKMKVQGIIKNACIVMYLDDDDKFCSGYALNRIVDTFRGHSQMWLWRVQFQGYQIPSNLSWTKQPINGDINTAGFAHSLELAEYSDWGDMSRGDYRTAISIFNHAKQITWIDEVLSMIQHITDCPEGKGDDL